ncbi:MAG: ERCC4 domain-containing protein [Candidatus Thiodiazotropha sp.]
MRQDVNIIIDDREVRSGIVDHLRSIDGVSTNIKHLTIGDYIVNGQLLIERKTLLDFAESIKDGRLFHQTIRLLNTPMTCLLILEGTTSQLNTSRMHRESLQGAMISLTIKFGMPILRSLSSKETAHLIVHLVWCFIQIDDYSVTLSVSPEGKPAQARILRCNA